MATETISKPLKKADIQRLVTENTRLVDQNTRMLKILNLSAALTNTNHIDIILDSILEKTQNICNAEASSLWMVDEEAQDIYLYMTGNDTDFDRVLKNVRLKIGQGICGWVVEKNNSVLVSDCQNDSRFQAEIDKKTNFVSRTMICVPLVVREHVIGAMQILNKKGNQVFDDTDLTIASILGNQIAISMQNARLNKSVIIDADTNLYRREYFMQRLKEELLFAKREKSSLAIMMCDIDRFKRINDTHGHQIGDQALAHLAGIMHHTIHKLGSGDIVGRYGGEEFCGLLLGYPLAETLEIAENVRRDVEKSDIVLGKNKRISFSISIGVAHYPKHKRQLRSEKDFIRLADEALFVCKNQGRNCVALYEAKSKKKRTSIVPGRE